MITAKLADLDERGQWLARALYSDRYQPLQGGVVRFNKFAHVPLRSVLSYERRFRLFDSTGRPRRGPLNADEEAQLARILRCYGPDDSFTSYSFSPIVEMYEQGNRCAHCYYAERWDMSRDEIAELGLPHGLHLSAPNGAPPDQMIRQINNMGKFAQWWIAFGGFEPLTIAPTWETQRALNALFGRRANVALNPSVLDEGYFTQN